jgi:hypothetical protein
MVFIFLLTYVFKLLSYVVATLALGLRPRQGLTRVWDKRETREAHIIFPGVQENVRE